MMGHQTGGQKKLFYSFNLDDHVPAAHLPRHPLGLRQLMADLGSRIAQLECSFQHALHELRLRHRVPFA